MRNHESSIVPIEISTSGRFVTPSGDVRRDPKAPVGRVAMESTGVRFDCPEWPHGMTPDPGIPIERNGVPWAVVRMHSRSLIPPRRDLLVTSLDGAVQWLLRTRRFVDEICDYDTGEVVYSARRCGFRSTMGLRQDLPLEEATLALLLAKAPMFALTSRWPSI